MMIRGLLIVLFLLHAVLICSIDAAESRKSVQNDASNTQEQEGVVAMVTHILNPILHTLNRAYSYTYDTLLSSTGRSNTCSFVEDMSETLSGTCV